MPRIPRVRGLPSLQAAIAPSTTPAVRSPFILRTAALSTSARLHGTNTDWLRKKLWKGEAPGPEDPYTQRPEPEDASSSASNLPDEALQAAARPDYTPEEVERSRLVLPPRQRVEAATEKELESLDPSYAPATSIEDLAEVQPVKTWWDQPGHWGAESEFRGFAAFPRVEDRAVIEVALRRAVVEALALRDAGLLSQWAAKKWPAGARAELDETLAVEVQVQDGEATLKGDVQALTGKLTSEAEEPESVEPVSAEETQEIVKSWDASWKQVSIKDQHLKFAVCSHHPKQEDPFPQS